MTDAKRNNERRKSYNEFQKKNRMNEEACESRDKIEKHLGKIISLKLKMAVISVLFTKMPSQRKDMRFMSTEVTQKLFILRLARQRVR